jgi:hypothetical protein
MNDFSKAGFESGSNSTDGYTRFHLNMDKYAPYVADFDMTDDQKGELLETLWSIMRAFVDLGFDVGKVDLCAQLFSDFKEASDPAPDGVELAHSSTMETQSHDNGKDGHP